MDGWLSELESYEIGRAARTEVRKTLDYMRIITTPAPEIGHFLPILPLWPRKHRESPGPTSTAVALTSVAT